MTPYVIDLFSSDSIPAMLIGVLAIFLPLVLVGVVCLLSLDFRTEILPWFALISFVVAGALCGVAIAKPMLESQNNEARLSQFKEEVKAKYDLVLTDEQAESLNPPFWPLPSSDEAIILGDGVEIPYKGTIITVFLGWDGVDMLLIDLQGNPLDLDAILADTEIPSDAIEIPADAIQIPAGEEPVTNE